MNKTSFPVIQNLSTSRRRLRYSFFLLLGFSLFAAISLLFSAATVEAASRKVSQRVQKKRLATKRRASLRRGGARKSSSQEPRTTVVPATVDAPGIGEDGDGEKVDERQRWFMMQRAYPYDTPPAEGRLKAYLARPRDARRGKDGNNAYAVEQTWRNIGPSPTTPAFPNNWGLTSGRLNCIAVHPTNPQIVLIGASTGGIWRSIDGGTNFTPVSDNHVDLAVGSIAFSKRDPSIVYAGMGDPYNGYFGTGVLKSIDAGATWMRVSNGTLPPLGTMSKIEVDPTDSNRVFVLQATYTKATSYSNVNSDGSRFASGVFISTNGGVDWQKTLSGSPRDLAIHPTNPRMMYVGMNPVSIVVPVGSPPIIESAVLKKSDDGGMTWTPLFVAPTGTNTNDMRVAVSPEHPDRVYLLSGNRSNIRLDVIDSLTGLSTTKSLTGVDPAQFGYNSYLHIAPNSAETIYVGTRDLYKSGDGGGSWTNLTKNFTGTTFRYDPFNSTSHPDQHALAFHPTNSEVIYIGNDGGISLSSNGGASFVSLNASLSLTQFVGISMHPTDPNVSYGGTQDNGTQFRLPGGKGWQEFAEGDGGHSVVNPLDPRSVFTTYVYGRIRRWHFTADGSRSEQPGGASNSTFGELTPGQRIGFYAPFKNNGVDSTVYFGTYRLFVSTNFADAVNVDSPTWTAPGGMTDLTRGGEASINCTITPKPFQCFDVLSAIGVERKANAQVIYTGSAAGRVMVTQNGGANWTEINLPLGTETIGPLAGQTRFRFIESITVDPSNSAIAYVTLGGFGTGHVFRTTNFGQTWTDIGGTPGQPDAIPNVPVSAFLIDPQTPATLYAGSDIGVFRSTDNGAMWTTFNNGMLPAVVTGFATNNNGAIQLSTYGRGAFELVTTTPLTHTINGQVTLLSGAGLSGVTMTLSGGQSSAPTATTDGNGNYSFTSVAAGGNYILSASKPNFTFSPQLIPFNNLGANQTVNFTSTLQTFTLSGRIVDGSNNSLAGATVTLSGSQTGTATTDASGNYSFANLLAGGTYTVTPVNISVYSFTSQSVTNLSSNQTLNFAGTLRTYVISGKVSTNGGVGLSNVTVTLSNGQAATTMTDAQGNYSFANLPAGRSYTVTPTGANYTFAPPSTLISSLIAGQTVNFAATLNIHSISGRVTLNGAGLGGATVTLSGSQTGTATTDASGNYSFANLLAGGTYTVTPSLAHYTFTAPSQTFSNLSGNQTTNFTGTLNRHTTNGRVTDAGGSLAGVIVTLTSSGSQTGTTVITDAQGNYSFPNLSAGSDYTVTPSKQSHTFNPSNRTFTSLSSDQTANFSSGLVTYTLNGRLTEANNSSFAGVTVNLSGSGTDTTMTDQNGNYSFPGVTAAGNYTVTPSLTHYTFAAPSQTFNNLSANQTANFTGTRNTHTLSGRVTEGNTGLGGVTVALIGSQTGTATADAQGNYAFGNLAAGGTYTLMPSRANYGFDPASQTFSNLSGTQATVNFTASRVPASVQFSASSYQFSEGDGLATIVVTRSGDTSGAVSVDVATVDDPAAVPCSTNNGTAYARCDYATSIETVTFTAGDTQPKSISISLIDDSHVELPETLQLRLLNPSNAATGALATTTLTITDNGDAAGAANSILQTPLFVRMQYLDFLSREPEAGEPWSAVLNNCSNVNTNPICDRIAVSKAFFESLEFRLKGFYVFNFYRVAFNRLPEYVEVIPDMRSVTGQTPAEVYAKRAVFPVNFTGRPEFKNLYDAQSNTGFVNALLDRYRLLQITTNDPAKPEDGTKVTLTRADLINRLANQTLTRGQALRAIVESNEIGAAEFNRAYVAMQYYGYLRRTPESAGYNNWLTYLNANPADARTMVNGFMNSPEYRVRFGL